MKLPPPPGPHLTVDEMVDLCSAQETLDPETEARAIHHLALPCPQCWAAFDQLPALEDSYPSTLIGLALTTLMEPPAAHRELRPNHRAAIAAARSQPLGFCRLLVEEAWRILIHCVELAARDLLPRAYGLILGNGACLFAAREAHDLQASLLALIARAHSWCHDPGRAAEAVRLAKVHLARGQGGAEPEATLLEVEAEVAAWQDLTGSSCLRLHDARQLVRGYEPADREAEILRHEGLAIARSGHEKWPRAAATFRQGLAILDQLEPGTNPALRFALRHELAMVEGDLLFYNRILGRDHQGLDAATIEQMLAEEQESFYMLYECTGGAAGRAVMRAKILVFTDPERARAEFRKAMAEYAETSARSRGANLLQDLLFLWARAADCRLRGVDVNFLVGIWDFPQEERFFSELMAEVEAALAGYTPLVVVDDQIRQLRRAVRARSRPGAEAGDQGDER